MKIIEKVFVVGAGQMGSGIAQIAAQAGFNVLLNDITLSLAERGLGTIKSNLDRNLVKGRLSETERSEVLQRIILSTSMEDAKDVDLAVEAAVESMEVKTMIFKELDKMSPPHALLASNTSSLPITEIAAMTGRPDQVIGLHFMNPVPVMNLVEVIRGLQTADARLLSRLVSSPCGWARRL